jgi:hypothetical protein
MDKGNPQTHPPDNWIPPGGDWRDAKIKRLEKVIAGIKVHANAGTSLSWRMCRIKDVLAKADA